MVDIKKIAEEILAQDKELLTSDPESKDLVDWAAQGFVADLDTSDEEDEIESWEIFFEHGQWFLRVVYTEFARDADEETFSAVDVEEYKGQGVSEEFGTENDIDFEEL